MENLFEKIAVGFGLICLIIVLVVGAIQLNEVARILNDATEFCVSQGFEESYREYSYITGDYGEQILCSGKKEVCQLDSNKTIAYCGLVEMEMWFDALDTT